LYSELYLRSEADVAGVTVVVFLTGLQRVHDGKRETLRSDAFTDELT
jgi:hypothetical protein